MIAAVPGRTAGQGGADDFVCLVYHDVQPATNAAGGGPERFSVPLASFERVLDTIARAGYRGCSLADAIAARGARRVAITFDDGDLGQYQHAFPALAARGMTATFYIATDWVGRPGYVTWAHLREMVGAGMSIQSHTRSHPYLSELDAGRLRDELSGSKKILDDALGQDTAEIAFPGGDAPARRLTHVIADSGYRVSVGTRWGRNPDVNGSRRIDEFVKRCTVRGETTEAMAQRIITADPTLALSWVAKEALLRRLRSSLGASRYARWRRVVLDTFAGSPG